MLLLLMFSTKMEFQLSYVVAIALWEFFCRIGTPGTFGFFSFVTAYFLKSAMTVSEACLCIALKFRDFFFLENSSIYKVFN